MKVLTRYDLAAGGGDAIKKRFLEENRNRRHLTPMSYAVVSRALYEMEIGTGHSDAELKQRIAEKFKINPKTLERWWALLGLPIELQSLIERKELPQQLGLELLDYAEPQEIQELVELARSSPAEVVKQHARQIVNERKPAKPRKEMPPDHVLQQFLESGLDMAVQYEAIAKIVRRDLGERKQMLYCLRRLKYAELVVPLMLDIVTKSERLEADELDFRPTVGRSTIADVLKGPDLLEDVGRASQLMPKRTLPPLKLRPAKKLLPLKLRKQPAA
jgi:hypothetical protein